MATEPQNVTPEEETVEEVPQWLRMLVVGLGIAIILMLALIVGTILKRTVFAPDEPVVSDESAAVVVPSVPSDTVLPDLTVIKPDGATVVSANLSGSSLVVLMRLENGQDQILVVDRRSGAVQRVEFVEQSTHTTE